MHSATAVVDTVFASYTISSFTNRWMFPPLIRAFPRPREATSRAADGLSQVTLRAVRNQWFTAASRLPHSASSAITAARALLESTCQTILLERGETPDTSGD